MAQVARKTAPGTMRIDSGVVASGTCLNECLGFALPIPQSWDVNNQASGGLGHAAHLPKGELMLLPLEHGERSSPTGHLGVKAKAADESLSTKDLGDRAVRSQVDKDPQTPRLVPEVSAVAFEGQHFPARAIRRRCPAGLKSTSRTSIQRFGTTTWAQR